MIKVENLSYTFSGKEILHNLTFSFETPTVLGIIGPNGTGKSTLMRLMAGILDIQQGNILYESKSIMRDRKHILSGLSFLPEKYALYENLSVMDNLLYFKNLYGRNDSDVEKSLNVVGLTSEKKKKGKELSSGMKRLLMIAIALIKNPRILILDEPTNGLDQENTTRIRNILKELHLTGMTIVFSSHNLLDIKCLAKEILILRYPNFRMINSMECSDVDMIENLYYFSNEGEH